MKIASFPYHQNRHICFGNLENDLVFKFLINFRSLRLIQILKKKRKLINADTYLSNNRNNNNITIELIKNIQKGDCT